VVIASQDVQLKRLMTKRKMNRAKALMRIEAQPPQEERVARADAVIDNSGDVVVTWKAVQRHFAAIPREIQTQPSPAPRPAAPAPPPIPPGAPVSPSMLENLKLRRAKRGDLTAMSALMAQATNGNITPSEIEMMENLFSKGYFVAEVGDQMLGLVGLRTENLIAGIDDFWVRSSDLWPVVGKALLESVEAEANTLSCEVALLFARPEAGPVSMAFFKKMGYNKKSPQDLLKMWREAAQDYYTEGSVLLVKQLLDRPIMKPI
jgi:dephospho-CoA kinase